MNTHKKEFQPSTPMPDNKPVEDGQDYLEPPLEDIDPIEDSGNKPVFPNESIQEEEKSTDSSTSNNTDVNTHPDNNKDNLIERPENPDVSDSNSSVESPESPKEEYTQQEKENDKKRKQIQNTYGFTIVYGNETMSVPGKDLIRMTDSETIKKNLDILEKQMQKYPSGFFESFEKAGMPLTILLVEGIAGKNIAGAADMQDATKPKLILTNRNFEEVIHHEMMHCIDLYLNIMMYRDNLDPFTEYIQYNPDDFEYGNTQYVEKEAGNPHFWFDYAKTNVSDDRAELFKAMMTINSVLLKRGALKDKGAVICKQIKKYFDLQEQTYWEKSIGISA